jgi:co-chaperonin GroES (HSP10)
MSFRPLHDRILVRRVENEEKTKGGIIIPDTAKEKPQEGDVIAAGPGARNDAGQIQALDHGWGSHPVRQMVRYRDQDQRRRPADHEGKRRDGYHRSQKRKEAGRLNPQVVGQR